MGDTKTEVIAKLIGQFKSTRYLFAISVISGILLLSPKNIINSLGVSMFIQKYRVWVAIVFLIAFGFWVADISVIISKKYKIKKIEKLKTIESEKRLKNLTIQEKKILSYYIDNQTRTQHLRIDSGVVNELVYYGIIYRSANVGDILYGFAYNIQPWAWNYLNKHPELLQDNPNYPVGGYL